MNCCMCLGVELLVLVLNRLLLVISGMMESILVLVFSFMIGNRLVR